MLIEPSSLLDYTVCERHEFEHETHSICIGPNSKSLSYKLTLLKDFSPKSNEHEPISRVSRPTSFDSEVSRSEI